MAKLPKNASWCLVHQYTTFKTYYNNCKPLQITFTSHLIRYTLLVLGWNTFQNICHRFNKKLQTLLTDYDPHRHDSTTQLLQICRLHLHDTNVPSHCIPKCSIGLRSGFSGGRLNKVNALYSGKIPVEQQFWKYSVQPVWHQQPCHVHGHHSDAQFDLYVTGLYLMNCCSLTLQIQFILIMLLSTITFWYLNNLY